MKLGRARIVEVIDACKQTIVALCHPIVQRKAGICGLKKLK